MLSRALLLPTVVDETDDPNSLLLKNIEDDSRTLLATAVEDGT